MLCLFACFCPAGASAQGETALTIPTEQNTEANWNLEADTLNTLADNTIVEATGNVILKRGSDILKADFARYYTTTNWVYLRGNVFVHMGRDDIKSEEAEFDLHSKTGWLTDGNVFMTGPHIYFSGARIIKHWGDRYTFNKAKVTTCDGPNPAWSMNAEQAVVEIDGYAQLFHSSFDVKNTGIFYSPFMVLPAKTTRQSGLLMPDFGYSNKRGVYYTQPYFWAIDDTQDLTLYAGMMTKIGPLFSAEYRAHPTTDQKTWLGVTGIYDKDTVDIAGTGRVTSGSLRTNQDRYWFRGMADGYIGASTWRYRSDIDFVSDQDYLKEFNQGPTGFNRTRNALFAMFGRDIQEQDQSRVSSGMIYKDWQRIGLIASMRYEQDPTLGHGNRSRSQDELVQRLPQLDAFLYKGKILPELPFELESHFQSSYMYRAEGTSGWRSEIYPKLSMPVDLGFASLIGTVGLRQTYYNTETKGQNTPLAMYSSGGTTPRQTGETRTLVDFDLQAYTEASRVWKLNEESELPLTSENVGKTLWTAFRHEIQPRVHYSRLPRVNQEKNPFYTMDDRIIPKDELTYSITNIFTRKGTLVTASGEGEQRKLDRSTYYQDLVRWKIQGGYDFEEGRRTSYLDKYSRRPVMDFVSDLEAYPLPWLGLSTKLYLSPYDGSITRHDYNVSFQFGSWGRWATGMSFRNKYYDYQAKFQYNDWRNVSLENPVNLVYNSISWAITPEWALDITDYRNMREGGSLGKTYNSSINLSYNAQCYRIIGSYRYDGYDKSYTLMVELPGIFD